MGKKFVAYLTPCPLHWQSVPQEEWLVSFHLGGMLWFISLMKMRMRMRMNLLIWNDHFYLIHNSLQLMRRVKAIMLAA
jgi:hypothetical protein